MYARYRAIGITLATIGAIAAIVALLFAFWAHEDIKQARNLGDAYVAKEKGNPEGVSMVFEREVDKLGTERRNWSIGAASAAGVAIAGAAVAVVANRRATVQPPGGGRSRLYSS